MENIKVNLKHFQKINFYKILIELGNNIEIWKEF